jgi:5-methylcytosine-specific restriction endonuclease McrA
VILSTVGYQTGIQKDFYNLKAFILHRDNYKCQSRQKVKHSDKLHVHHILFRSKGGTDTPDNLITLCEGENK